MHAKKTAYSFFNFFAMCVEYLGGPDATVKALETMYHAPCGCCPGDHKDFYTRLVRALQLCLFIR